MPLPEWLLEVHRQQEPISLCMDVFNFSEIYQFSWPACDTCFQQSLFAETYWAQFNDVNDIFRIFWNRAGVQMILHSYPKSKLFLVLVLVTFCEQSQKCCIHSCIHPGLGTGGETCSIRIIGHAVMVMHRLGLQSTSVIQRHIYIFQRRIYI